MSKMFDAPPDRPNLPAYKKVIFTLTAMIFFVLLLELSARLGLYFFLGSERLEKFHIVQSMLHGPLYKDKSQEHLSNKTGFRGPDFKLRKPKGTFRVLTIGGSAAGGELSHELRKLFEADCPAEKCELIDGGVAGSVSIQELYNLTRWMAYRPDLIIVYDGWNDVYYSRYTPERYARQYEMTSKLLRKWNSPGHRIIRASYFVEGAIAGRGQMKNLFDKPLYAAELPEDTLEVSWMGGMTTTKLDGKDPSDVFSDIYRKNLIAMADTAARARVPIIFILQPSLTTVGLKQGFNEAGQKILDAMKPKVQADWLRASKILFPLARKAQREASEHHKNTFYDFNEELELRQDFFYDLVHLNEKGNRWAAARIFEVYRTLSGTDGTR